MELNQYQSEAMTTAQAPAQAVDSKTVAFLGLAGEAGELLSEYKKHLRDGNSYMLFPNKVREELGDLLWYIARVGQLFDISLESIAEDNLKKIYDRWPNNSQITLVDSVPVAFDESFPEEERLPRSIEVTMEETTEDGRTKMRMFIDGVQAGDDITDNSYTGDGYRFHDVFHLSFAMVLGWSPVLRQLLRKKRKSASLADEVEDGGRAKAVEEGISAMVFAFARDNAFFEGITSIDRQILTTIRKMTAGLEVSQRSLWEWESAILQGYAVWRQMDQHGGGVLVGDFTRREIRYRKRDSVEG